MPAWGPGKHPDISAVFERLAASYEALALEVERLEQTADFGA